MKIAGPASFNLRAFGRRLGAPCALCFTLAATLMPGPDALARQLSPGAPEPAQDLTALPFEQLLTLEVYSASKFMQKSKQAPASVTVISAADIRAYGWRTLADLARSVRGMAVNYDRNYSYLGARGVLRPGDYNTRFLLQIDGVRINDAVYDQAPLGAEFPLELDLIERVEFVPGPGSSIYGSNAFFGVINVITKEPGALPGVRAALEAGQFGAAKAQVSVGWDGPAGARFLLAASAHDSAGRDLYFAEFDTPDQHHGVAQGLDYERGARWFAKAVAGPFSVTLLHAQRSKGVPTASFYQSFNDPRSGTVDRQSYVDAVWRSGQEGPLALDARLYWGANDSLGDYANPDPQRTLDRDGGVGRWWGSEIKLVATSVAGHKIVAGAEFQRDYRLDQFTYTDSPRLSYLDDHRQARRAGLYLQDEIALGQAWLLNLGLRHDRNANLAGVNSPRAALIGSLGQASTIKAIYGTAYRAPNSYELYYAYPGEGGQLPNPLLRPERIASRELALVQQFSSSTRATVSLFHNTVSDMIDQQVEGVQQMARFENGGHLSARGLELEVERSWPSTATLRASYSYSRASEDGQAGTLDAPSQLAKLNLSLPLGQRWRAGLETQYVGARRALRGDSGGYWLANLNLLALRLAPHLEAALAAYNLFDRRYTDPGSTEHLQAAIAQDRRTLRARLSYVF
ncbi:MAG: TonB-dependent receptor [Pseudomonadota bacterium]